MGPFTYRFVSIVSVTVPQDARLVESVDEELLICRNHRYTGATLS